MIILSKTTAEWQRAMDRQKSDEDIQYKDYEQRSWLINRFGYRW